MSVVVSDRICIIGAGPAGLATAHRLRVSGYENVVVLEKLPEVGGLCLTYEYGGEAFDLGANYVTSAYKRVRALAKEVDAKMYIETDASFFDTLTGKYQSIIKTARGSNSLFSFGWKSARYLAKRRRLDSALPSNGYGDIHRHPEMLCSFAEWLDRENLSELKTLFEIPITLMGYGSLEEIPAPYALTYMNVETVVDLMIFGSMPYHRWPRRFVDGFQRFWERIAEPLDVRTDVQISSVSRTEDLVTIQASMPVRQGDKIVHQDETLEFDRLILCCPLQLPVTEPLLDLTATERDLFERITLNPFCVTTYVMESGSEVDLQTRLVNLTPIPERSTSRPTIITQQYKSNPLVTFYSPVDESGVSVRSDVIAGIEEVALEIGIKLGDRYETWNNFAYFPQVSVSDIASGWYHQLESMQGQNRTYYNGGIMAFELIEPIVEYSDALVENFFTGDAGPPLATPASQTPIEAALSAGFADLMEEVEGPLEVQGEIPAWLEGDFVRNGPARWQMKNGRLNHWFDGVAMLHRFAFADGEVSYRNRYLRSANYEAVKKSGRNRFGQFDTDPDRTLFEKLLDTLDFNLQFGQNNSITVAQIGSEWMAIGETPTQLAIDPSTADTLGVFKFKDRLLSMWTCSHMVASPAEDRVYSYSILAVPLFASYKMWFVEGESHERTVLATIRDRRPSYMHSFGVSEDYLVFTKFPLRLSTLGLFANALTGRPFIRNYKWDENRSTEGMLIEKATGNVVAEFDLPPMFAFHHSNAWQEVSTENGTEVVFELAAYDDAQVILETTSLDHLLGPSGGEFPRSTLMRCRVPINGSQPPTFEPLSDAPIEMQRYNDSYQSRVSRFVYGQSFDHPGQFYDRLIKIDTSGDPATNTIHWSADNCWPSEPVFVARPGATTEDDGVVTSVVLDMSGERPSSFLLVLDASSLTELARAEIPVLIPFGLHGAFASNEVISL